MRALPLVVAIAAGCANHAKPETKFTSEPAELMLLGEPIRVLASWKATCSDWSAKFDALLDTKDGDEQGDTTRPCAKKPLTLEVTCTSTCDVDPGLAVGKGFTSVTVVPRALGPLSITAISTRTDTREAHRETAQVEIALPDRLELQCAVGPEWAPCGPEGVSAGRPFLRAFAYLHGEVRETREMMVNGAPLPIDLSIGTLYPGFRLGDPIGVEPGTYKITLAVGSVVASWNVVAR